MRQIDLNSNYLQAVGYVSDNRLDCSSVGRHDEGIPLGPPDMVTKNNVTIWTGVELPFARGQKFRISMRDGYAVIVDPDLALDVFTGKPDISVSLLVPSTGQLMSSRGTFKYTWLAALGDKSTAAHIDDEHIVAMRRSSEYDIVSITAMPTSHIGQGGGDFAKALLPLGGVIGAAFVALIAYLTKRQLSLPAVLKAALKANEFELHYQPIVDLSTGRWSGVEALLRWRRASGELVRPDLFIPVAEDTGLIERITERVLELVARDAEAICGQRSDFHIGINFSAADLHSDRVVEKLTEMVQQSGCTASSLMVEVSERGILKDEIAREVLHKIRGLGVAVAVDDFGTGYSSLSYLTKFELDYLKIDKSFVEAIGTESATSQVVLHIIEMAKSLQLSIIAEGVETEQQAEFLRAHKVSYAQGWLFGKAVPLDELMRLLNASS